MVLLNHHRHLLDDIGIPQLKKWYLYLRSADALAEFLIRKYEKEGFSITGQGLRKHIRKEDPDFFKEFFGGTSKQRGRLKHYSTFALYRIDDLLQWESDKCQQKES